MKKTHTAVMGIVKFDKKILILKRNADRSSSPNKWQPVSGFIDEREALEDAVLRETKEETNLNGEIKTPGKVVDVTDKWGRWINIVFLVAVDSDEVKIDLSEHSEFKWINSEEISNFDCVAGMKEYLEAVGLL